MKHLSQMYSFIQRPKKNIASLLRIISLFILVILFGCTYQKKSIASEKIKYPITLVIHGGAGTITKENLPPELEKQIRITMEEALEAGYGILAKGGTSVDAVIRAIQVLEDSPLFNAGKGAVFTRDGKNELDASIMDGKTGMAGAVAAVTRIKSPIEAAYTVMVKSEHVLLTGKGAEVFAEQNGLEIVDPEYFYTEDRYQRLLKVKEKENDTLTKDGTSSYTNEINDCKFGTGGAVALDQYGNLAAGTSTGGMTNKRFGRVGDSPIIGAGTYADNKTCAVSATGHGEFFIRNVAAYDIAARMKYQDKDVNTASEEVINELKDKGGFGGVICLDHKGNIAMPFNTEGMYRGYIQENRKSKVLLFRIED